MAGEVRRGERRDDRNRRAARDDRLERDGVAAQHAWLSLALAHPFGPVGPADVWRTWAAAPWEQANFGLASRATRPTAIICRLNRPSSTSVPATQTIAIQIAKQLGLWVATTTSTRNVELVTGLGADDRSRARHHVQ